MGGAAAENDAVNFVFAGRAFLSETLIDAMEVLEAAAFSTGVYVVA